MSGIEYNVLAGAIIILVVCFALIQWGPQLWAWIFGKDDESGEQEVNNVLSIYLQKHSASGDSMGGIDVTRYVEGHDSLILSDGSTEEPVDDTKIWWEPKSFVNMMKTGVVTVHYSKSGAANAMQRKVSSLEDRLKVADKDKAVLKSGLESRQVDSREAGLMANEELGSRIHGRSKRGYSKITEVQDKKGKSDKGEDMTGDEEGGWNDI